MSNPSAHDGTTSTGGSLAFGRRADTARRYGTAPLTQSPCRRRTLTQTPPCTLWPSGGVLATSRRVILDACPECRARPVEGRTGSRTLALAGESRCSALANASAQLVSSTPSDNLRVRLEGLRVAGCVGA
eukprot:scaffold54565_cov26-Tisochrysis_lutea.AAC.2